MLEAYQLTKVPVRIVKAKTDMTSSRATIIDLYRMTESIITDRILYSKNMFQGDSLSLILILLSVNTLSFIFRIYEGYFTGSQRNRNTESTRCFFIGCLKLYSKKLKMIFDQVTTNSSKLGF